MVAIQSMKELTIDDIPVSFPFLPYRVQEIYMEKVIKALRSGSTALLESPTGTGKTLCLLCATLAWAEHEKSYLKNSTHGTSMNLESKPQIIYCSRTHSQLSQVIQELKSSPYSAVKGALLGSKEHFCVHREVSQLSHSGLRNHACMSLRAENSCRYFSALRSSVKCSALQSEEILDMEELVQRGKTKVFCPYYLEREVAVNADIIFMPYNYVVDSTLRKQLPFGFKKNCVLIIDEAHNLPSLLSAGGSINLSALSLATAIQDCSRCIAMITLEQERTLKQGNETKVSENDAAALKIVLKRLEDLIAAVNFSETTSKEVFPSNPSREVVRAGSYMYTFLEMAMITSDIYTGTAGVLGMSSIMAEMIKILQRSDKTPKGLVAVYSFLENIFNGKDTEDLSSVKFVIQEHQETVGEQKKRTSRTLGFWRLDSLELRRIQQEAYALILTSGTLSPMEHFAAELNIRCDIQLHGSHVIEKHQLMASILCKGPSGERLNSSFSYRGSSDYLFALGMALQNISRHVPGGTLIFFPSYSSLYSAVDFWRSGGKEGKKTVWALLCECRPVFMEPIENSDLAGVVQKFKESAETRGGGAILLAVCRGKISEGVNFSDRHGRCVVVTGIPYPNCADLFVRLKRKYLSEIAAHRPKVQGKFFTGDDWYRTEAMRAVGQCVGRAIRHRNDYGALVFADERFQDLKCCLPEWIHPSLSLSLQFRDTFSNIVSFFRIHEASFGSVKNRNTSSSEFAEENKVSDSSSEDFLCVMQKKAHEYMKDQHRTSHNTAKHQKRMRLEEAEELPRCTRMLPLSFRHAASTADGKVCLLPTEERQLLGISESSYFCHKEPSVVLPSPSMGSTSKEFCGFLKKRLKPELYENFKGILVEIARLRQKVNLEGSNNFRNDLASLVQQLTNIFATINSCNMNELMMKFGLYLPKELYLHYLEEVHQIEDYQRKK